MKAKQQLEEKIIDSYLSNKIDNGLKNGLLMFINGRSTKELNRVGNVLNNLKQLNYVNKAGARAASLKEYKLDTSNEEHVRGVFNSLVKKGFLNKEDQENYSLSDYLGIDPDILTDEEFVTLYELIKMQFGLYYGNQEVNDGI